MSKRFFYAVEGLGVAPESSLVFVNAHGVQSVGLNTNFNLQQIHELGMLGVYDQPEGAPEVEVSAEKVLDGNALLGHLSTRNAPDATLVGRSAVKCNMSLTLHTDTQSAASGTPLAQVYMSGLFLASWNFAFQTEGPFTESCSWVGNDKRWLYSGFTYTPSYTPTGIPSASEGVNVRQHFDMYTSRFPTDMPGVSASGTYGTTTNESNFVLQKVTTGVTLGRESIFELGKLRPYFRFVGFPVEVTTEFMLLAKGTKGDDTNANGDATSNTSNMAIYLKTTEGTRIDLGSKNRKMSVQESGGNAGQGGNNVELTYRYRNSSEFKVTHPNDPTTALAEA